MTAHTVVKAELPQQEAQVGGMLELLETVSSAWLKQTWKLNTFKQVH